MESRTSWQKKSGWPKNRWAAKVSLLVKKLAEIEIKTNIFIFTPYPSPPNHLNLCITNLQGINFLGFLFLQRRGKANVLPRAIKLLAWRDLSLPSLANLILEPKGVRLLNIWIHVSEYATLNLASPSLWGRISALISGNLAPALPDWKHSISVIKQNFSPFNKNN